jgi:hypothetical protein
MLIVTQIKVKLEKFLSMICNTNKRLHRSVYKLMSDLAAIISQDSDSNSVMLGAKAQLMPLPNLVAERLKI